MFIGYLKTEV